MSVRAGTLLITMYIFAEIFILPPVIVQLNPADYDAAFAFGTLVITVLWLAAMCVTCILGV